MGAVFKREFRSFFTSPVGYIVFAVLFIISGLTFYTSNLLQAQTSLVDVFSMLFTISTLLVLPVLSMRLLSDDKRQKTDQALLTAPTGLTGVVVGKFLAALLVFAIGISITLVYAVVIAVKVTPDWLEIIGNYLGLLLLGGAILAIGMFISSLTESQFIAALGTFVVSFMLLLVDIFTSYFPNSELVASIVSFLSISTRYSHFTIGVIGYNDIIFFLSMQVLFLFLKVRILDRRRWS